MPVVHMSKSGTTTMTTRVFSREQDLEDLLADHPSLLMAEDEPEFRLVRKQVVLKDAGKLDLLLVDAAGRPTVVEVKLRRNGESRRQVLAQVFDYVSSLSDLTVRELDKLVGGDLESALRSFDDDKGPETDVEFNARWGACADALRAGNVRVVVAIDQAPKDLIRMMRFVSRHSDLDVRLVELGKYSDGGTGAIVVPRTVVGGDLTEQTSPSSRPTAEDDFSEVIAVYNSTAPVHLRAKGKAANYRQIHPPGWPGGVHYEFVDSRRDQMFRAEIHIENDRGLHIRPTLEQLAAELAPQFSGLTVEFDPKWSKHRGRTRIGLEKSNGARKAADTMTRLIKLTIDRLTKELTTEDG